MAMMRKKAAVKTKTDIVSAPPQLSAQQPPPDNIVDLPKPPEQPDSYAEILERKLDARLDEIEGQIAAADQEQQRLLGEQREQSVAQESSVRSVTPPGGAAVDVEPAPNVEGAVVSSPAVVRALAPMHGEPPRVAAPVQAQEEGKGVQPVVRSPVVSSPAVARPAPERGKSSPAAAAHAEEEGKGEKIQLTEEQQQDQDLRIAMSHWQNFDKLVEAQGFRELVNLAKKGHQKSIQILTDYLQDYVSGFLDVYDVLLREGDKKIYDHLYSAALKLAEQTKSEPAQATAARILQGLAERGHIRSTAYVAARNLLAIKNSRSSDEKTAEHGRQQLIDLALNKENSRAALYLAEAEDKAQNFEKQIIFMTIARIIDPTLPLPSQHYAPADGLLTSYAVEREAERFLRTSIENGRFAKIRLDYKISDPLTTILLSMKDALPRVRKQLANMVLKAMPAGVDARILLLEKMITHLSLVQIYHVTDEDAFDFKKLDKKWFVTILNRALEKNNLPLLMLVLIMQNLPRSRDTEDVVYQALCKAIRAEKYDAVVILRERMGVIKLLPNQLPEHLAWKARTTPDGEKVFHYLLHAEENTTSTMKRGAAAEEKIPKADLAAGDLQYNLDEYATQKKHRRYFLNACRMIVMTDKEPLRLNKDLFETDVQRLFYQYLVEHHKDGNIIDQQEDKAIVDHAKELSLSNDQQ